MPEKLLRKQDGDSEARCSQGEVFPIMRHNCLSLTVDCCFKDHFIASVAQLRTPHKVNSDRNHNLGQFAQKPVNEIGRKPMLLSAKNLFIFQKDRCGSGNLKLAQVPTPENFSACTQLRS